MEKEKVTTAKLREMKMGETKTFNVPQAKDLVTGAALAYRAARIFGCKFSVSSDSASRTITITKNTI